MGVNIMSVLSAHDLLKHMPLTLTTKTFEKALQDTLSQV
jgi:hypothetical protein